MSDLALVLILLPLIISLIDWSQRWRDRDREKGDK